MPLSVLRRQRDRLLQHDHTPTSRIGPNTSLAGLPRLRRHQLRLRIAGILDNRHVRQAKSASGDLPVHGSLPRIDLHRLWSH